MASHGIKRERGKNNFQFTFFSEKHKPVACIIDTDLNFVEIVRSEQDFRKMAISKICTKRGWSYKDFVNYGYNWKFKYRRVKE